MLNFIKVCLIFLNIFTIFASPSNSNKNENTAKYYPFVKIGSKHYFVNVSLKMNWYESFDYCRSIGGDLVNIESLEELLALQKYVLEINIGSQLWTDGNDLAREGRYMSHTTGRPLVFVKWLPNNPDNEINEDCIEVRMYGNDKTLQMNDNKCDKEYYAICQYREPIVYYRRSFCVVLNENENCVLRNFAEGFTQAADMFKSCSNDNVNKASKVAALN